MMGELQNQSAPRLPFAVRLAGGPSVIGVGAAAIDGRLVPVEEQVLIEHPFGRLIRFDAPSGAARDPMLVIAPLSGMRASLLHDLITDLLAEHDVHLLMWRDAAEVPFACGPFGLEDNIADTIEAIRWLGGESHVIGLCQSAFPALAAVSLLAASHEPVPASLTLIGGKIDTRVNPARVDRLVCARGLDWYENNVITTVKAGHAGEGRRVYSASLERLMLSAYFFRQMMGGGELVHKFINDDGDDPRGHPFFDLFFAVTNLPAEFFLDNIKHVFREASLPRRRFFWRGTRVVPACISRSALLTIEGERDDIAPPGQSRAAHDLCLAIPASRREHFLCPEAGHFDLFHGAIWRRAILPRVMGFIHGAAQPATRAISP